MLVKYKKKYRVHLSKFKKINKNLYNSNILDYK